MNTSFIKKLLFMGAIVFITLILSPDITKADAFIDGDNFCVVTTDKKRTSDIWYRTHKFVITRCRYNPPEKYPHSADEYIWYEGDIRACYEEVEIGGMKINRFTVPIEELMANASGAWREEVQKALDGTGPGVWIKFDGVMYVYHGNSIASGPYYNAGLSYWPNPAQIQAAERWANPRGLETHFNQYIFIGKEKEIPPTVPVADEEDYRIATEETHLKYTTGNSSAYDLGEGIPGGENVTNNSTASRWYGKTNFHAHTDTEAKYWGIPWTFLLQWDGGTDPITGQQIIRTETVTGTFDYTPEGDLAYPTMVAYVAYMYLDDPRFYDLDNMVVTNFAYPGSLNDPSYTSNRITPAECIASPDYVNIADENIGKKAIESWYPNNAKHIKWAAKPGGRQSESSVCETREAAWNELLKWYDETRPSVQQEIYDNTETKNDKLVIDGVLYLKNDKVIGCNFKNLMPGDIFPAKRWKDCTHSSAVVKEYKWGSLENPSINEPAAGDGIASQTVTIPEDMDNGKYATCMEVAYTQMIRNCKYPFLVSGDSNCYCGEGGACALHSTLCAAAKYDFKTKHERSFRITDSVCAHINVHSPVIAPVVIKDDQIKDINNNKNQLTTGEGGQTNKSTYSYDGYNTKLEKQQLLLDEDYLLDWEGAQHRGITLYGDSGKPSKYDKYVENKYMRFPFDVVYEGKIYEAVPIADGEVETLNEGSGDEWELTAPMKYTPWIKIKAPKKWDQPANAKVGNASNAYSPTSENHWQITPIYIPSFADEVGGSQDLFNKGKNANIYYKVEAKNVDGYYGGDHTKEQEKFFNKNYTYHYADDGAKYVATYRIPVQTSGQIYDFMITGTDDIDAYQFMNTGTHIVTGDVAFCKYKMDKRVGTKNRYGGTGVRYRADGQLIQNWDLTNTLPLTRGKSSSAPGMGDLMRGTKISFSLKTIANLWDYDSGDYITITPTFRYVDKNGKVKDNIKIYYNTAGGSNVFVEYGKEGLVFDTSTKAKNVQTVKMNDPEFDSAYYTQESTTQGPANDKDGRAKGMIDYQIGDWVRHTVNFINTYKKKTPPVQDSGDPINYSSAGTITKEAFMNQGISSYNFSSIILTKDLRMLSGEWEQLKRNTKGEGRAKNTMIPYNYFTYDQEDTDHPIDNTQLLEGENPYDDDTGEGKINLSYNTVIRKGFTEEMAKRFLYSMQTWFGQYYVPADLYIVDLDKHPDFKGLSDYIKKAGKDFRGANDPIFAGDEGYLICNFDIRTINDGHAHLSYYGKPAESDMWKKEGGQKSVDLDGHEIPLESGDVFVIDMGRKVRDKYSPGIFNIN